MAGYPLAESKASQRLVRTAQAAIGWLPGGLRYPPGAPGHYLFGQHADRLHDPAGGHEFVYCQLPL